MTWSYSADALSETVDGPLMQVRLHIGDTDEDDQQLQDEEIQYLLTQESTTLMAASRACEILAARYARQADKKVGDLSITYTKTSENYRLLAASLMAQGRSYAVPSAGGVEVSEKESAADDATLVQGSIRRGMHDFVKDTNRLSGWDS